jgi:FkbM family methyltransferase
MDIRVKDLFFDDRPYKIACIDTFGQHPSWFSFEDESIVRDRWWHVAPGDVVFDVGSNYGSYALTALATGATHVFAWSPQENEPSEASLMRQSLVLNGWEDRCTIIESGVFDRSGWINTLAQTFSADEPQPRPNTTIRVERMDDWRVGKVIPAAARYWMKLDVEGAEVGVLRGGEKFMAEFRPTVLVENHNFKDPTLEQQVRDHLTALGYKEQGTHPYHSVSHSLYLP